MHFLKKYRLKIILAFVILLFTALSAYTMANYHSTSTTNGQRNAINDFGNKRNFKAQGQMPQNIGKQPQNKSTSKNSNSQKEPPKNKSSNINGAPPSQGKPQGGPQGPNNSSNSQLKDHKFNGPNAPPANKSNNFHPNSNGMSNHGMMNIGANSSNNSNTKYSLIFIIYSVIFFAAFMAMTLLVIRKKLKIDPTNSKILITGLLIIGFLLRIFSGLLIDGHPFDINIYKGWASSAANNFLKVYGNNSSIDYPPLYIYVLFVIGKLSTVPILSKFSILLLKLPSMIADILSAYLIYKTAKKHISKEMSVMLSAFYVFNPAVLINSTIWGQVDSFFTLIIIAAVYFLSENKLVISTVFFASAALMKPQGIIFLPLLLFAYITYVKKKDVKIIIKSIAAGIITALTIILPFSLSLGNVTWIYKLYMKELSEYPYATNNAFNFYGLIGANNTSQTKTLFILNYHTWGLLFIILITLFAGYIYIKGRSNASIFMATVIEIVGVFNFSVGMHERYMFTALAASIFAYIYIKDNRLLVLSALFSLTIYINTHTALFEQFKGVNIIGYSPVLIITSLLNVLCFGYLIKLSINLLPKMQQSNET